MVREAAVKKSAAELEEATVNLAHFTAKVKPRELEEHDIRVDRRTHAADHAKDELGELTAMYEADEFAKSTKELVLKRGRRSLEMADRELAVAKQELSEFREHTLPQRERELTRKGEEARRAHEKSAARPQQVRHRGATGDAEREGPGRRSQRRDRRVAGRAQGQGRERSAHPGSPRCWRWRRRRRATSQQARPWRANKRTGSAIARRARVGIEKALDFFVRTQNHDGSWGSKSAEITFEMGFCGGDAIRVGGRGPRPCDDDFAAGRRDAGATQGSRPGRALAHALSHDAARFDLGQTMRSGVGSTVPSR